MKKNKILICSVGTATALSVIKGLKKQKKYKVSIIGIDMDAFVSGKYFVNKFYLVPKVSEKKKFYKRICEILAKEKIDLVIPIMDEGLPIWSRLKEENKYPRTNILVASRKSLKICQDKNKITLFFKKIGVPTVKTYLNPPLKIRFPIFIKPRFFGRATMDAYKIKNKRDLDFYVNKLRGNYVLQEYINGKEYTADCLSGLDGKFITAVIRQRIATKGGLSIKGEIIKDKKALRFLEIIVESLKIPGVCNIQFFKRGRYYYFFEINPRFAGTHAFTIEGGLNSIYYLLEILNGRKIKQSDINIDYGAKMLRFWDEIIIKGRKIYTPKLLTK